MQTVTNNTYIETFANNYIKKFRNFSTEKYLIEIHGIANYIDNGDQELTELICKMRQNNFDIRISDSNDPIDMIFVEYYNEGKVKKNFQYTLNNLSLLLYLSSKTGISTIGIIIMQIISRIIFNNKTLYKAIILDLDDTLWKGTLKESGSEAIKQTLNSEDAIPFVTFMKFIQVVAKELGIYVAICSRNEIDEVEKTIQTFNTSEFPLKGQIDCIVANNNDKSENIKEIAKQLSILPESCVFIDDNELIRDEVRSNLPEVFVPDWKTHDDLMTQLISCCIFDRFEISLKSRNRRKLYNILQVERKQNRLPHLLIKPNEDINNKEAITLYKKTNTFIFSENKVFDKKSKSIFFELYRANRENLGICSAMTYSTNGNEMHILNWAISCRYFEIGLEEYILMFISDLSKNRTISFSFNDSGYNTKVIELFQKYKNVFSGDKKDDTIYFSIDTQSLADLQNRTNIKKYCNE